MCINHRRGKARDIETKRKWEMGTVVNQQAMWALSATTIYWWWLMFSLDSSNYAPLSRRDCPEALGDLLLVWFSKDTPIRLWSQVCQRHTTGIGQVVWSGTEDRNSIPFSSFQLHPFVLLLYDFLLSPWPWSSTTKTTIHPTTIFHLRNKMVIKAWFHYFRYRFKRRVKTNKVL